MQYSYEVVLEQLGARIKELRKKRGWTLRYMVIEHKFHLTHWQGFETGKRGISLPSLLRVAEVFDMTLAQLVEGIGEEPKAPVKATPKREVRTKAKQRKTSRVSR